MVSEILHKSGINMGVFDEIKGYDEGNKYERSETHDLNVEMLGHRHKEHSLNIVQVLSDIRQLNPEISGKMKRFVEDTNRQYQDWGFKDPRTCLTYFIWKEVIPQHKIIAILRHPSELWTHYRNQKPLQVLQFFLTGWKALHAWYVYNNEILKILKASDHHPYLLVNYDHFIEGGRAFDKLCDFAGRPLKDCRNSKLYRSKKKPNFLLSFALGAQKTFLARDVMGLYEELKRYAV